MPDFPTQRGRRTQAAIDAAARTVVVRNGILATTVADITAEAGRSAASFYNYYDSKEAMVRQWALRFRDDANQRALSVIRHGLSDRERAYEAAAAHWYTYRNRLAEAISVSQLAMVSDDFAQYWSEICQIPISFITETVKRAQAHGYCVGDDPQLMAEAIVAMFNQFCYLQLSGKRSRRGQPDDQACIQVHGGIGFTWEHDTNVYYRRALMLAACFGRGSEYPQRVVDTATTAGMRPVDIDLDPSTEKLRAQIRAEVAALKAMPREPRTVAIAEGGWVLPYLPKPWGRAASPVEQIIIAQEFTAGRVKRPQIAIATWIVPSIVAFGTDNQKQRLLPPTFRGDIFWCQLFSEPGAGSDLASLATKATRVDGGWRITGQKIWTTGAQYSQWGALLARTDPSAPKHNGITYFLLDMKSEGVQVKPLRELTGKEFFNTVYLDDVFVPDELVLGEVNRGWEVSRNTLTAERVSIGGSDSTFLPTLGEFVDFVRDYRFEGQFDQVARHRAGQLIAEGHATKLLNLRSTLLTLAGGDPMAPAAISKLLSMRTGQGYAEFAVSSFGTDAVIGDTERLPGKWGEYLLASRATTIYGGTSEVQLNIIAERLLGLPRDP